MEQAKTSDKGHSSFILNKKPIPDVTLIVHEKSLDKNLLVRIIQECHTPYFYHKFIICDIGSHSKKYILKSISNFVYPATFRALHFTISKNKAIFLSRNCQELLLKICSEKFRIPIPECPETPFRIIILANFILYEEVQLEDNSQSIIDVISKRFNKETRTIDLNEFSEDEGLEDYFPLFQIKFLLAVTSTVASLIPKHIKLQNNHIRDISNLHPLKDFIETLDLCDNMMEDITALMPLINFKTLKHLSLSGNPLCEKYDNYNYVLDVKGYCQNLEKLDGFNISVPVFQKNSFCSLDAMDLVKSFIEHFFLVYDSTERQNLIDLYHKDALFSVTSKIIPYQKNTFTVQLDHYGITLPFTIYGATEIIKLFKTFPKTSHDPYPPVCDVTLFTDTHASIIVGGVFRELSQVLSFTRHFLFKRSGDAFLITNDQLHVSNALDSQTGWSFGFPMHLEISGNPLPFFQEQYIELEEAVHKITNMNYEYSQKYLDNCQYDLKKTLQLFSELHVRGEVPEIAFTPESVWSKNLRLGGPPYSENIRKLTYEKHKSINLKTIWETLDSARIRGLTEKLPPPNPTIQKILRNINLPEPWFIRKCKRKKPNKPLVNIDCSNIFPKVQKPEPKSVTLDFHMPIAASLTTNKPVQKVKPAAKSTAAPLGLVELAEKMARNKELAAKKAAELGSIRRSGQPDQTLASTPSMVPAPAMVSAPTVVSAPSTVPAPVQPSQNYLATNFTSINLLGPVADPQFASMGQHFVPGRSLLGGPNTMLPVHQELPAHLMTQFQMQSGFSMQQGFPMQHQFPTPMVPGATNLIGLPDNNYRSVVMQVPRPVLPNTTAQPRVGTGSSMMLDPVRFSQPKFVGSAIQQGPSAVATQFCSNSAKSGSLPGEFKKKESHGKLNTKNEEESADVKLRKSADKNQVSIDLAMSDSDETPVKRVQKVMIKFNRIPKPISDMRDQEDDIYKTASDGRDQDNNTYRDEGSPKYPSMVEKIEIKLNRIKEPETYSIKDTVIPQEVQNASEKLSAGGMDPMYKRKRRRNTGSQRRRRSKYKQSLMQLGNHDANKNVVESTPEDSLVENSNVGGTSEVIAIDDD